MPILIPILLMSLPLTVIPLGTHMTMMDFGHHNLIISWLRHAIIGPMLLAPHGHSGMKTHRIQIFLRILILGLFIHGVLTVWTMVWCCVTPFLLHGGFKKKKLYLSCFQFRQFNVDQQKQLFHAVPPYGKNHNFLLWYSRFVSMMMGFGLYVLPAQTLCDGSPLEIWFRNLPVHVQVDIENVFGVVLASLLQVHWSNC